MSNRNGFYPRMNSDVRRVGAVGNAGGVLLTETVRRVGLDDALATVLAQAARGARPGQGRAGPGGRARARR